MVRRTLIAALGVVGLSACQLDMAGLEPAPTPAPPAPPVVSTAEMRDACAREAQSQGAAVLSVGEFRPVGGSGGRLIGTTTTMQVTQPGGATVEVRCSYSYGDGIARITLT
ncbi:MAG: hypothetical protein ACXIUV_14025 [Alkalilacustris sp.]